MKLLECILTASDCYKAGQTIKPQGVMVHSTGANNPLLRRYVQPIAATPDREELLTQLGTNPNGNHWNQSRVYIYTDKTRTVGYRDYSKNLDQVLYEPCVHAFIGKLADGSVAAVQTLPWEHRGWHCGVGAKGTANDTHISFEICEDALTDPVYFNQAYQAAVELTAMLCREYGLDPLADGVVICHQDGYKRGVASNHGDVYNWFPKHGKTMDDFRADVVRSMNNENEEEEDMPTYKTLKDVPEHFRPTIQKLMEDGSLVGEKDPDPTRLDDNIINVSYDYCRIMTTLDRRGDLH
ncbi:MAG: N-acetylmuramoyl-L-alanine amidase [Clostridiales bacterium]|nr:N-acetylmuramoyl-L-alanine amidase [Clostridiales bacterium]